MAIFKKKEADAYNELDAKKNASNVSDGMLRFNRVSPFANAMYSALFIFIAAICVLPVIFVIIIMFIMAVGRIFNSDFGLFYKTTRNSSALYNSFVTLDVYVYNSLFNSKIPTYGYASAAGFMQSVFGCLTLVTANAIVSKFDKESAFF